MNDFKKEMISENCLTTVVISSQRAGHAKQALDRIIELANKSGRIITFTKIFDNLYLSKYHFSGRERRNRADEKNGSFHQFVLKSNYSLEDLEIILNPINFPDYGYYSNLNIIDVSL